MLNRQIWMHACCCQAAKQAELAALDLVRLSKPVGGGGRSAAGGAAAGEGGGLAWSFLSHLGTVLLNGLQMTVRNIHVCFQARCPGPCIPCHCNQTGRFRLFAEIQHALW